MKRWLPIAIIILAMTTVSGVYLAVTTRARLAHRTEEVRQLNRQKRAFCSGVAQDIRHAQRAYERDERVAVAFGASRPGLWAITSAASDFCLTGARSDRAGAIMVRASAAVGALRLHTDWTKSVFARQFPGVAPRTRILDSYSEFIDLFDAQGMGARVKAHR